MRADVVLLLAGTHQQARDWARENDKNWWYDVLWISHPGVLRGMWTGGLQRVEIGTFRQRPDHQEILDALMITDTLPWSKP